MTLEEFFKELAKIKDQFDWTFSADMIRCRNKKGGWYCPITAVCQNKENIYIPSCNANEAAWYLKMNSSTCTIITHAADFPHRLGNPIRDKMLEILNLKAV